MKANPPTANAPDAPDAAEDQAIASLEPALPTGDSCITFDHLVGVITLDTLPNMEQALDQLTLATDLFDVPALDFEAGT